MENRPTNNKELFENIFTNLFENKIIYHERVTVFCEVDKYEVTEKGFQIWLKPVKPLIKLVGFRERSYSRLVEKKVFSLSSTFEFGNSTLFNGKMIGRPYCPFILWPNKELVEEVSQLNEVELTEKIYNLLWD